MSWRRRTYVLHRWIGLVVSLQLLAWSVGGLYFSWFDLDTVHGTADTRPVESSPIAPDRVAVSPAEALARAAAAGAAGEGITAVVLRAGRDGAPVYELRRGASAVAVVGAADGQLRPRLDRAAAEEIARADFAHPAGVVAADLLTTELPLEARGRNLPLWRVELDHPRHPRIYLDAVTGEVVARRNTIWRVYDFLWMLHIMDYGERESFHHPWLTVLAGLAVATSASGLVLWAWRLAPRRARASAAV